MNSTLISISGPTAVGKTLFAIELAKKLDTEIISFDSRQFYKEISIGTAVPSKDELAQVKHHFIQHKSIHDQYKVSDYKFTKEISPLFTRILDKPNSDQKKLADIELGINSRINEKELRKILIKSLGNSFINFGDAISLIKTYIKPIYFYFK